MHLRSLLLSIFLYAIHANAQDSTSTISGKIVDAKNAPLEFVNVVLLNASDSSLVKAAVTDEQGAFVFDQVLPGDFRLLLSQVGYKKTYTDVFKKEEAYKKLDPIKLEEDAKTLQEVEITNKRPLIEHKPGKTIVNVENSIISSGGTVYDVLKRSPGVLIDKDGNITYKGKSSVMVMIDGKLTYLSGEQLTNLLKSMPSDQADQIELMSKPPAKYDASGNAGIINIKLKKSKYLGFNGTAFTNYSQGFYARNNVGLNANYRNEKFNVYGNSFLAHRRKITRLDITRKFSDSTGALSSVFNQQSDMVTDETVYSYKGGVDFFVAKKHTIGLAFSGNGNLDNEQHTYNSTVITNGNGEDLSSAITRTTVNENPSNFAGNLNYKWDLDTLGGSLTADLDYARFTHDSHLSTSTDNYDSSGSVYGSPYQLRSVVPVTIDIRSAKFDLSKPLAKSLKLEAGGKSSFVETDNDVKYYNINNGVQSIDSTKTNHFIYSENINAGYVNFSKEFKKLSFELGLRGEQTIAHGHQVINDSTFDKKYFQVFPTFFVSYKINKNAQLDLSVNRRIDRPSYDDLNPFKNFLDPYTYIEGNPFLRPQFTNSGELCFTYMDAASATFSYSKTTDIITEVIKQVDSTRTSYATSENLDVQEVYNLEFEIPAPIAKWWTSENYLSVFYNVFKGEFQGAQLNNGSTTFVINSQNEFDFKKGWSAELSGEYTSAVVYGIFKMKPQYNFSAGVQKKCFQNRGKIKVGIQDFFSTPGMNASVKYQNMDIVVKEKHELNMVYLSLVYNFGKTTVKRSQQHSSGAQDEINRVKSK